MSLWVIWYAEQICDVSIQRERYNSNLCVRRGDPKKERVGPDLRTSRCLLILLVGDGALFGAVQKKKSLIIIVFFFPGIFQVLRYFISITLRVLFSMISP